MYEKEFKTSLEAISRVADSLEVENEALADMLDGLQDEMGSHEAMVEEAANSGDFDRCKSLLTDHNALYKEYNTVLHAYERNKDAVAAIRRGVTNK